MIDPQGIRNANIALAVTAPIILIGGFLLRHANRAVIQAFGMFAFFFGIALLTILEIRYDRRQQRDSSKAAEMDQ
jgi:hypothetical protein